MPNGILKVLLNYLFEKEFIKSYLESQIWDRAVAVIFFSYKLQLLLKENTNQ